MRVVVSLTTIPKRLLLIIPVVESIVRQEVPFDEIYLNIPDKSKKGEPYPLQKFKAKLEERGILDKVNINNCIDTGPSTKLVPTLNKETDENTRILTLDDDMIISPKMNKMLKEYITLYPDKALSLSGWIIGSIPFYEIVNEVNELTPVDWIQGATGIVYKRGWLDLSTIFNYDEIKDQDVKKLMEKHDDHWFNYILAKKGIERCVIPESNKEYFTVTSVDGVDSISRTPSFIKEVFTIGNYMKKNGYYDTPTKSFSRSIAFLFVSALACVSFIICAILNKNLQVYWLVGGLIFYYITLWSLQRNFLSQTSLTIKTIAIVGSFPFLFFIMRFNYGSMKALYACILAAIIIGVSAFIIHEIKKSNHSGWTQEQKEEFLKQGENAEWLMENYSYNDSVSIISRGVSQFHGEPNVVSGSISTYKNPSSST